MDDIKTMLKVQEDLGRCLIWYLRRTRGPAANRMFARIITALCQLRELCRDFYQWVESKPFENYSQVQQNKFVYEWFTAAPSS